MPSKLVNSYNYVLVVTHILRQTWYFVCPDAFVAERIVWIAFHQEMLKESHVLQTEERYLVRRLKKYPCKPNKFFACLTWLLPDDLLEVS